MNAHTISRAELAKRASVNPRTIIRHEKELRLTRVPCGGRKVVYQYSGTEEALIRRIKAPYRRGGAMRRSLVPDPVFVRRKITSTCGPQPEIVMDGCMLTLSKLLWVSLRISYDDPIQVNATRHQRLVGAKYSKQIMKYLIEAGFMEHVANHISGKRCRSYRLRSACYNELAKVRLFWPEVPELEKEELSLAEMLVDAAIPFEAAVLERLKSDSCEFLFPKDLDIDTIANEHAHLKLQLFIRHPRRKRRKKAATRTLSSMSPIEKQEAVRVHAFESCKEAYHAYIRNPLGFFRPSSNCHRIYHSISGMPRRLRFELQCRGEFTSTLDIHCCQPFLLGLLLEERREEFLIDREELLRFIDLTQNQDFYTVLGEEFSPHTPRDELKRIIFRDLLFGHKRSCHMDVFKVFSRLFPSIGMALGMLHRSPEHSLARELQRREARIIYGYVLPALQAAFPAQPITTIHDAILLPSSIAAEAQELMAREVKKATGKGQRIKKEGQGHKQSTHMC